MKRLAIALFVTVVAVAPVHADLKYVSRLTARPSTVPMPPPTNPLYTMLGGLVIGAIVPMGGLRITSVIGERGARIEYGQPYLLVPAGGVMLVQPDGSALVINPSEKTYWKVTKPTVGIMGGALAPDVQVTATGDTATVAGVQTNRSTLTVRATLPLPAEGGFPGMPRELSVSGDVWLAPSYARYSKMAPALSNGLAAALGMENLFADGFPMRLVVRSELFAGQQIESVVTSIGEVSVPASTFEVPAGFVEVPQPPMPSLPVGR
jgi:hypothetical protein